MAEGTAVISKMSPEAAVKNMETIAAVSKGKAVDLILVIPLAEKSTYLKIIIPKKAVEEKLESLASLEPMEKAKELIAWMKASRKAAFEGYENEPKKATIKFNTGETALAGVKPKLAESPKPAVEAAHAVVTTAEPVEKKATIIPKKEEKAKEKTTQPLNYYTIKISSPDAKENGPDIIIPIKMPFAGTPLTIQMEIKVTKKDLSGNNFSNTKSLLQDLALDIAEKKGLPDRYDYGGQTGTVSIYPSIKTAIGKSLSQAAEKLNP
ncbi:hypothetical protein H0O02_05500 [Candidatus Micrarchaeota archaeon]|nr:hypothetical protein [Candidatus Micrarchaeota archaeon]